MLYNPTIVLDIGRDGTLYWKNDFSLHNKYKPAMRIPAMYVPVLGIAGDVMLDYYWLHGSLYSTYLEYAVAVEQLAKNALTHK